MLGVQSVPDGLATGLLAGVNPLAGLYGYLVGTVAGAFSTSSTFMAVQGTGAMAMLMADVAVLRDSSQPGRALVTLSMLTGAVMLVAGLLKLGSMLRFVSNAVMVGFINAVGVKRRSRSAESLLSDLGGVGVGHDSYELVGDELQELGRGLRRRTVGKVSTVLGECESAVALLFHRGQESLPAAEVVVDRAARGARLELHLLHRQLRHRPRPHDR